MEDLHEKWPHRWLTNKAQAKKSQIHGIGVFANEHISKGEDVGVLGGIIVPKTEIEEYWTLMGHVGIQIDENFFIVPTSSKELQAKGIFNHSCEPNLGFSNSITLMAIREIRKDEELVFDYAFSETFHNNMNCKCDTENCRKKIFADDWKDAELQNKYGKYFSPYLRDRFHS